MMPLTSIGLPVGWMMCSAGSSGFITSNIPIRAPVEITLRIPVCLARQFLSSVICRTLLSVVGLTVERSFERVFDVPVEVYIEHTHQALDDFAAL